MNRRAFLKVCAAAGVAAPYEFSTRLLANSVPSRAIALGSLPLLFVDDGAIERNTGAQRTFHAARTRSKPVLVADRPWEKGRVYLYGTVLYDQASRRFRMWYGIPKPSDVLYATSKDGLHWEKPSLGIFQFEGSGENNIVLRGPHSPSLVIDSHAADPSRKFKLIGSTKDGGCMANYSPDGMAWTSDPRNPVMKGDDTLTLTQNPTGGEFLLYHKRQVAIRGAIRRTIWLSRSRDFQIWSAPEMVLAPDQNDDLWAGEGQRTDIYDMSVFPHAGGFVGLPMMFRVMQIRPKSTLSPNQAADDGPIEARLATSPDGRHWSRPAERLSMIPLGAHGDFDRGAILGASNQFVHHEDATWLYYTALNTTHGAPIPPKQLSIGRAEWRIHGLASLDAGHHTASVETRSLRFENPQLSINADASKGTLRAALLDENGRRLPGYSIHDCTPLRRNATQWIARWKERSAVPTDRDVRVLIEMANARLFSLASARQT